MKVDELSLCQLDELKGRYLTSQGISMSLRELANVGNLVSDEKMNEEYQGTEFTNDDFFCSKELEEDEVICGFCGEAYDKSSCRYERNFRYLCPNCIASIKSHGETLWFKE